MSNVLQSIKPKSPVLIKQLDDETLLKELRTCWHVSTALIEYMASLYREAASRPSINLAEFKGDLWEAVKLVARDKLVPELAAKIYASPHKRGILADLPKDVQHDVAATGATFKTAVLDQTKASGVSVEDKSILEMSTTELRVVMGGGGIRTVAEQKKILGQIVESEARRRRSPSRMSNKVRVDADAGRGVLIVGAYTLKPYELAAALDTLGFKLTRKVAK